MAMQRERQAELEDFLTSEKRRLWHELLADLGRNQGEDLSKQYDLPQDPGERSLVDLLSDMGLAVADLRLQQLTRMEDALGRLRQGTYGICEDCGQQIPEERLRVDPYVACCVPCQERREGLAAPPRATL